MSLTAWKPGAWKATAWRAGAWETSGAAPPEQPPAAYPRRISSRQARGPRNDDDDFLVIGVLCR